MNWTTPWYQHHPKRMIQEQEAMATRFAGFQLVRGDDGALGWLGYLTSNRGNRYKILVDYRTGFPHEEPYAFIIEPKIISQHMWKDGHLCLMYPDGTVWKTNTTAATMVAIVAAWIFCYEDHKANCSRGKGGKPCMDPKCPHWPGDKM